MYRAPNTTLIGEVLVRSSKTGDFELTVSKGPGITLLSLRQDATFAEVKGGMAGHGWSGRVDQAPPQLRELAWITRSIPSHSEPKDHAIRRRQRNIRVPVLKVQNGNSGRNSATSHSCGLAEFARWAKNLHHRSEPDWHFSEKPVHQRHKGWELSPRRLFNALATSRSLQHWHPGVDSCSMMARYAHQ